jgi:hypothetical protein
VSPDGKVYTNAPWDESGAEASVYQDGKMLGFAGGTHGWGNGRRQRGSNQSALRVCHGRLRWATREGHLVAQGIWPQKGKPVVWHFAARDRRHQTQRTVSAHGRASQPPHAKLAAGFLVIKRADAGACDKSRTKCDG